LDLWVAGFTDQQRIQRLLVLNDLVRKQGYARRRRAKL